LTGIDYAKTHKRDEGNQGKLVFPVFAVQAQTIQLLFFYVPKSHSSFDVLALGHMSENREWMLGKRQKAGGEGGCNSGQRKLNSYLY
jgi:hypothetical protein